MASELSIQERLYKVFETFPGDHAILRHVANGEKRDRRTAAKLYRMGVRRGTPDFVWVGGGQSGFLELKTEVGSLSDDQLKFIVDCTAHNVRTLVAYDLMQAIEMLKAEGVIASHVQFRASDETATADREARRRDVRKASRHLLPTDGE